MHQLAALRRKEVQSGTMRNTWQLAEGPVPGQGRPTEQVVTESSAPGAPGSTV